MAGDFYNEMNRKILTMNVLNNERSQCLTYQNNGECSKKRPLSRLFLSDTITI